MEQSRVREATSIQTLAEYAMGQLVELPPFAEGQPFFARLTRPSMLMLAKLGKIPNQLLSTANELFFDGTKKASLDPNSMKNMFELIDVICESSFVTPKYSDIKSAGLTLTDDQFMFIFNYTQQGVDALKPFRGQRADIPAAKPEQNVSGETVADDGDR